METHFGGPGVRRGARACRRRVWPLGFHIQFVEHRVTAGSNKAELDLAPSRILPQFQVDISDHTVVM